MSEAGKNMVACFDYVQDVFRNGRRLLCSADDFLLSRGFRLIDNYNWNAFKQLPSSLDNVSDWITDHMVRQYTTEDNYTAPLDIVTVAVSPWRKDRQNRPRDYEPMCIATRMIALSTPDEVYWIGAVPVWEEIPILDGKVRIIGDSISHWDKGDQEDFRSIVKGGRMIAISVPLLDITDSELLESKVLTPLLAAEWPLK